MDTRIDIDVEEKKTIIIAMLNDIDIDAKTTFKLREFQQIIRYIAGRHIDLLQILANLVKFNLQFWRHAMVSFCSDNVPIQFMHFVNNHKPNWKNDKSFVDRCRRQLRHTRNIRRRNNSIVSETYDQELRRAKLEYINEAS